MAVDRTGAWWRGSSPVDLDEYLRAYTADGYPVGTIVHATCAACGGTVFALVVDEVEGYAQCVCESCRGQLHMLDSGEYEMTPTQLKRPAPAAVNHSKSPLASPFATEATSASTATWIAGTGAPFDGTATM
jgi:hypothetical protein